MIYYHIFTNLLMFTVIILLLRHSNKDREERAVQMSRYENLAMRVRITQLQAETPEGYMRNSPYPGTDDPLASVMDVEGS